ncbi:TonB-dependent receptor [Halarcobacter ebronensis]|uniref:TonB-dependent receptor n=1 Tax=Halarcobacter ebronensis TaxID=1462615 RepID=A0A4Q1AKH8_9BACT|nr:TonB-dependent receptor [Halarcobacter ebronensis]QKF81368.1 TonB-dependent receptor [Halarcobacter ebronensis]RXK04929.1 TonB-dependent receptor [Halarcobacter ebronensis]
MKKIITIGVVCASILYADNSVDIGTLDVIEEINSKVVKDVSSEEIKSADLAESLMKNIPSISIVRRSGIANDIILRGQKKDNINVLIDDAKIYGACPNRMDPTISHVLSNNVDSIQVIEGPYDIENFGTLSGKVSVKTKEPKKGFSGEVNVGAGSFGYRKLSTTLEGGNDKIKFLISASKEESDQYEDGNGNDFYGQQVESGIASSTSEYLAAYRGMKAYEKKTLLAKTIFNIDDSSEIKVSYTANRSDNILYPTGGMDADYDNSNIYTFGYTKRDLGEYSKELNFDYYYSNVDHPMSTRYRDSGNMMYMTSFMKTSMWGAKLKNSMDILNSTLTYGVDTSIRNWRSNNYMTTRVTGAITPSAESFPSTDTKNRALFSKLEKQIGDLKLEFGSRYDNTDIENISNKKNYSAISANIFGTYSLDEDTRIFAGIGKSSRVPDARELYYSGMGFTANKNLEDTKNYEVDLGFEKNIGDFFIKTKLFYSKLDDYIYNMGTSFENIDAYIYGLDINGSYFINENLSFDYGVAYQRGKKDGDYADKDLAEVTPLKANFALNYEVGKSRLTTEVIAVDSWSDYDSSALEQELGGYALLNAKFNQKVNKNLDITLGVDNILDKTYNSTNTYRDISYVAVGSERTLFNDPGRYVYFNLKFTF